MGRGLLVFKGDKNPKKKKKKPKHDRGPAEATDATPAAALAPPSAVTSAGRTERKPPPAAQTAGPKISTGRGEITTSGTVVTGHGTKFAKDLRQGDALLVRIGSGDQEEMRVITMLLSDISINLSSPFSQNVTQPSSFRYIAKPRNTQREARQAQADAVQEAVEEEAKASGAGSSQELVYRERTVHGSYRIKRKQLDADISREDMLNMRSKKTSDKYC
jgi:hypothetical protein